MFCKSKILNKKRRRPVHNSNSKVDYLHKPKGKIHWKVENENTFWNCSTLFAFFHTLLKTRGCVLPIKNVRKPSKIPLGYINHLKQIKYKKTFSRMLSNIHKHKTQVIPRSSWVVEGEKAKMLDEQETEMRTSPLTVLCFKKFNQTTAPMYANLCRVESCTGIYKGNCRSGWNGANRNSFVLNHEMIITYLTMCKDHDEG